MKYASILYKNSEGTCLVYSTTTCRSPIGIGTASAIMPLLMTHSTLLPRLNIPQFRIFPPASPFSPYPIHFIPYSGLHQDDLCLATAVGQAPIVVCSHPSIMTLTLAPQNYVNMCEWRCSNCNMGQYNWSH